MRRRITYLVDSTPDPFATDILCHKSCWTEHVLRKLNNLLEGSPLQNIKIDDARELFFRHVDGVVFKNREVRQLQWLVSDYKHVVGSYGLEVGNIKSGYLKLLLIKECCEQTGFKEPCPSEWVYDFTGGGIILTLLCTCCNS